MYVYVDVIVIRCVVAITLTDDNCTTKWDRYMPNYFGKGGIRHVGPSALIECQKACEFDPSCIAVDWRSNDPDCWLNINPNHVHYAQKDSDWRKYGRHYELHSRCNITSGQCFHCFDVYCSYGGNGCRIWE